MLEGASRALQTWNFVVGSTSDPGRVTGELRASTGLLRWHCKLAVRHEYIDLSTNPPTLSISISPGHRASVLTIRPRYSILGFDFEPPRMLRRSRRRAILPHGMPREQQTDTAIATENVIANLGQPASTLERCTAFPPRDISVHPIQQGEGVEQGVGQVLGESQMGSGSTSEEQGTDEESGPENCEDALHTPVHDAPETTHCTDQAHGPQAVTNRGTSPRAQAANPRQQDAATDHTNLIHTGSQNQTNPYPPSPAQCMSASSNKPPVPAEPPCERSRPHIYTKQDVNEEVGTGAQKVGIGGRIWEGPEDTTREEQVRIRDDSSSGGVSPKDLHLSTRELEDDLTTLRPVIPLNALPSNVRSAVTSSCSLETSLTSTSTASLRPAAVAPRAASVDRSEYGGEMQTHQHDSSSSSRALSEPISIPRVGRGQGVEMGAPNLTSCQITIPCAVSRVARGRKRGNRGLRGGISRKPSQEACKQITPAAIAELMSTLLSGEGSSAIASADYFSRPPSRLPARRSATTTPSVSGRGIPRRESLHQSQLQLAPNQPTFSNLPEIVQAGTSANPARGKGKGLEYSARDPESMSEPPASVPQGSAIVPPDGTSGHWQNQAQTEALAHAHLAIVNRGSVNHNFHAGSSVGPLTGMHIPVNQSSSMVSYNSYKPLPGHTYVPQAPHIESIDGSTGVRSYQTLNVGEVYNILDESQRPNVHPDSRPLAIRTSNFPNPGQFDANVRPPVGVPSSAPHPLGGGDSQRRHLARRLQTHWFGIPMYQYIEGLATADPSTGAGSLPTLTNTNAAPLPLNGPWNLGLSLIPDPQDFGLPAQLSTISPEQRNICPVWPNLDLEQTQGMDNKKLPHSGDQLRSAVNIDIETHRKIRPEQVSNNLAQSDWALPANTQTSAAMPIYHTAQDYYSMSRPSVNTTEKHRRWSPLDNLPYPPEGTLWGYSRTTSYVLLDLSIWSDPSFGHWRRMSTGVPASDDYTLILRADCVDEWSRYIISPRPGARGAMPHVCATAPTPTPAAPSSRVGAPAGPSRHSRQSNHSATPVPSRNLSARGYGNLNTGDSGPSNQNLNSHRPSTSVPFPGVTRLPPSNFLNNTWVASVPVTLSGSAPVAIMHSSKSTAARFPWNLAAATSGPHGALTSGPTGVTPRVNDVTIAASRPTGFSWNLAPATDEVTSPDSWYPPWAADQ